MSTATEIETSILNALDFTPSLPCEHSQHDEFHPGDMPAEFIVEYACKACHDAGRYLICGPGRSDLLSGPYVDCHACLTELDVVETMRFSPIRSAS